MVNNKYSIRDPRSRFRMKILEYAATVEKFNVHQLQEWYYDNYPKRCPSKKTLQGFLSMIGDLEKLGYSTYDRQTNMEYKLRDRYVVDRKI
tara:strand:+ start:12680 stop:12952 length:273 start_codon:yes stop_codon:yes gene_type:complete